VTARRAVLTLALLPVALGVLALGFVWGADSTPTEVVTRTRFVPVPMTAEITTTTTVDRVRDCARPGVVCGMGRGGCVTTGAWEAARYHITPDPACGATT
jgi:hypothetical protein